MDLENLNIYINLTPKEVDTILHALKSEENYLNNLYGNIQKKAQGQIDNYLILPNYNESYEYKSLKILNIDNAAAINKRVIMFKSRLLFYIELTLLFK